MVPIHAHRKICLAFLLLVAPALMLSAGCGTGSDGGDPVSLLPNKVSAEPVDCIDERLVNGNIAFSLSIFRDLCENDPHKNIFISPASISTALAMTANGASGETLQSMLGALHLQSMSLEEMNGAFAGLQSILQNPDPKVELTAANSLWVRQGVDFNEDFLQRNGDYFAAEVRSLDFNDSGAAPAMNRWVEQQTRGKIKEVIQGPIDSLTVLFLINAIYFNGDWSDEFSPEMTREIPFELPDGTEKNHPVMFREGSYRYFQGDNFEAVILPYGKNRRIGMTVFLPSPECSLADFYGELTPENWAAWLLSFREMEGEVGLPRFNFEYEASLNENLKKLGMESAFNPQRADFSGMRPTPPKLYISDVKHKTYVDVNEKGTEAAAVTSVEFKCTSVQTDHFSMIIDRPFLFAITDEKTGAILFMGQVNEP